MVNIGLMCIIFLLKKVIRMIKTIIDEMLHGNFSFAILVVGILQLIEMLKKKNN